MVQFFFYEDGEGNAVDENCRPEPMDCIVDQQNFGDEFFALHIGHLQNMATSTVPARYNDHFYNNQFAIPITISENRLG